MEQPYLRRIKRCGLAGVDVALGGELWGFKSLWQAQSVYLYHSPVISDQDVAFNSCCSFMSAAMFPATMIIN